MPPGAMCCAVTSAFMVRLKGVPWSAKVDEMAAFLSDVTLEEPRKHMLYLNDRL